MSRKKRSFDIALIGCGVRGFQQLTLEQLEALRQANDVVLIPGLAKDSYKIFRRFRLKVHDSNKLYREGRDRNHVYEEIADYVLAFAKNKGGTVAAFYGHPLVYSSISQRIIRKGRSLGLEIVIYAGVSSIDEIFCLLNVDIARRDLQICSAEHLCMETLEINPKMDLLLMQPGGLGETTLCRQSAKRLKRPQLSLYRKLQKHLERFYPPNHAVFLVVLSSLSNRKDRVVEARVRDLVRIAPRLRYHHTIFIPALRSVHPASFLPGG